MSTGTNTLDNQAVRDWHARDQCWNSPDVPLSRPDGSKYYLSTWWRECDGKLYTTGYDDGGTGSKNIAVPVHPIPATLDAAAALMPKGWDWTIEPDYEASCAETRGRRWVAWKWIGDKEVEVAVGHTGDERADRFNLARLCRIAEGAKP